MRDTGVQATGVDQGTQVNPTQIVDYKKEDYRVDYKKGDYYLPYRDKYIKNMLRRSNSAREELSQNVTSVQGVLK